MGIPAAGKSKIVTTICRFGMPAVLLLGLMAPPAIWAASKNIVSRPVGVFFVELAPQSERLLSMPLKPLASDIQVLFANQLVGATNENNADAICKWNAQSQMYEGVYKTDNTGNPARDGRFFQDFSTWTPAQFALQAGEGFLVRNAQAITQTVFLCGEVVLDSRQAIRLMPGYNLIGYPFASPVRLNETTLATDGAFGGKTAAEADLLIDVTEMRNYWLAGKGTKMAGQWVGLEGEEPELVPGWGYWYQRMPTEGFEWAAARPYDNPFPEEGGTPAVVGMTLNPESDALTLTIAGSGEPGELLDIYYQDDGVWQVAATGLAVGKERYVTWTDAGSPDRPRIAAVAARFYLVGRGDIDSDGDGIPDAREFFVGGTNPQDAGQTGFKSGGREVGGQSASDMASIEKNPESAVVIAETYMYLDSAQLGLTSKTKISGLCRMNIDSQTGLLAVNGKGGKEWKWVLTDKTTSMMGQWIRLRVEQDARTRTSKLTVKCVDKPGSELNNDAVVQWSVHFER